MKKREFLFPFVEFYKLGVIIGMETRHSAHTDCAVVQLTGAFVVTHPTQQPLCLTALSISKVQLSLFRNYVHTAFDKTS